jgi:ABC-type branched-subunit amino acid transport system substrate-binding protein
MYYVTPMLPISHYPSGPQFIDDFEDLFGSPPSGFAAQAYDAAGICLRAIEKAILEKGGELPTREEVANTVRSLQDYQGITGTISFDEKGDVALPEYFVVKIISVDPAQWEDNTAVTSFKIPAPR